MTAKSSDDGGGGGGGSQNKKKNKKTKKSKQLVHLPGTLFRADRVLAHRTQRSRSECATLLKYDRVWQVLQYGTNKPMNEKVTIAQFPPLPANDWTIPEWMRTYQYQPPHTNTDQDEEEDTTEKATTIDARRSTSEESNDDKDNNGNETTDQSLPCYWSLIQGASTRLPMNAILFLDKKEYVPQPPPLLVAYHKPKWVLSVRKDPQQRPCLDSPDLLPGMHPVGRLDYDSSGLLLFSSHGPLTQHLLHPKHGIAKEYVATVAGAVNATALTQQLADGVETAEGRHTAQVLEVTVMDNPPEVSDYLRRVRDALPPEYNVTDLRERGYLKVLLDEYTQQLSTVRLVVQEGKHRMVRRMLANCGHEVVDLQRVRFGDISLMSPSPSTTTTSSRSTSSSSTSENPDTTKDNDDDKSLDESDSENGVEVVLKPGTWRLLNRTELQWAKNLVASHSAAAVATAQAAVDGRPPRRLQAPNTIQLRERRLALQKQIEEAHNGTDTKRQQQQQEEPPKRKLSRKERRRERQGDADVAYVNRIAEEMERKYNLQEAKREWRRKKKMGILPKDSEFQFEEL